MTESTWDSLWFGCSFWTGQKDNLVIENGAIAVSKGRIAWLGHYNDLPSRHISSKTKMNNLNNGWLLPGFIDCHTHMVYSGHRVNDFIARTQGLTYEQQNFGDTGIKVTQNLTSNASFDELYKESMLRAKSSIAEGVLTAEIKSGYGIDFSTERKQLQVARKLEDDLGRDLSWRVIKTYLALHALPAEYNNKRQDFVNQAVSHLQDLYDENLVDRVDAFCDSIGFNYEEILPFFNKAKELSLSIGLHTDQLSHQDGIKLASLLKINSVEHLEYMPPEQAFDLKEAGIVAVLLPQAYYYLQQVQKPPVKALREAEVGMAVATDVNPGSAPGASLQLARNMACLLFDLTPEEALLGTTSYAATALGLSEECGSLKVGLSADFVHWPINQVELLVSSISPLKPNLMVFKGNTLLNI